MKYISPEGFKKLKEELEERKTIKRQEIAERLGEAKSLGDLSENAEYAAAKDDQSFNEGKILELEQIIKEANLIKPSQRGKKKIQMGSVVEVKLIGRKANKAILAGKQSFMVVGFHEANPSNGKISNESPLGQAFFGHGIGDTIEVETPKGKMKYKIVSIK